MVTVLKEQGLLDEINLERISNFSNLDPQFTGLPYDPLNQYSVAYMWGTTGIAYRRDKITAPIDSWAALLDERYRDRIAMLDDVRETIGAMLKYQGRSLNSLGESEISEAAMLLAKQKPLVKAYDSGGFDLLLMSGDVWIAQAYSGQIAKAMMENENIAYVVPKEGCTFFVDNLCIPRNAKHKELAQEFINFVLETRVAAEIANGTGFSTPSRTARAFIRPELLTNEAAYPSRESLEKCELIREVGEAISIYDRLWTEIKSQ
jgi:spermidine/putrescine-binding protein